MGQILGRGNGKHLMAHLAEEMREGKRQQDRVQVMEGWVVPSMCSGTTRSLTSMSSLGCVDGASMCMHPEFGMGRDLNLEVVIT